MGLGSWLKDKILGEEEIPEPMESCSRCGFEFPEALMHGDSGALFCSECLSKKKSEAAEAEAKRKQAMLNQKVKYFCYQCKFHFSRKRDFPLGICPNCGSKNFIPESKLGLQ